MSTLLQYILLCSKIANGANCLPIKSVESLKWNYGELVNDAISENRMKSSQKRVIQNCLESDRISKADVNVAFDIISTREKKENKRDRYQFQFAQFNMKQNSM